MILGYQEQDDGPKLWYDAIRESWRISVISLIATSKQERVRGVIAMEEGRRVEIYREPELDLDGGAEYGVAFL